MKATGRVLAALLAIVLLLPAVTAFAAAQPTAIMGRGMLHFVVDGTEYAPPEGEGYVGGFFYKVNHTYVPLRFFATILKKDVGWDNGSKTVTIYDPDKSKLKEIEAALEQMKVEPSVIGPAGPATAEKLMIEVVPNVKYVINGVVEVKTAEETPGLLIDKRIYVPFRFVTENLGYSVGWDKPTYTITVNIAEADRIVTHYREQAEIFKDEWTDRVFAKLEELDLDVLDVRFGRMTDEQREQLLQAVDVWLPEVRQQMDAFFADMTKKLEEAGQPALQANRLRDKLVQEILLALKFLGIDGVGL